ncbi:MAG: phage portal protein [Pyrinomonadaceae bacterium]
MNTHIEQALYNFRVNGGRYARTERYYRGDHELAFATEKFANTFGSLFREFALNLCPAVCDAIRDKLKIEGFSVMERRHPDGNERNAFEKGRRQDAGVPTIWHRNRMDIRAGEIHKEAVKNGDAYLIVWPDADGNALMYPNTASSITVEYDEELPGKMIWAAKFWRTRDKFTRLNIFYPDRIERYITAKPGEGILPDAKEFIPFMGVSSPRVGSPHVSKGSLLVQVADRYGNMSNTGDANSKIRTQHSAIENPFGVVPVFHFANNASIGTFGRSELEDAIPVQDGMNKSVLDMLVAMEFCSYRQRWAAGIEIEYDAEGNPIAPFKAGVDHLWLTENKDARFGDFATASLDQFLKVKDGFRIDIASVTGTPLYYLLPHGRGFASGEAMRKAETRFIAKVRDRQTSFGQTWADAMQFALKIEGREDAILKTKWEDAAQLTEKEMLENILLKKEIGLSSSEALKEAGYSLGVVADE